MKKEQTVNFLFLIMCGIAYVFARIFRARYSGNNFIFLKYHFTDWIAPIVVLSYSGLLLNMAGKHSIKNFIQIAVVCAFCSFVWEYCAPRLFHNSTADWLDVISIFGGGCTYWCIINFLVKEKKDGKINL